MTKGPGAQRWLRHRGRRTGHRQNLLVAFMPWKGYNFEDAIVIGERVVRRTSSPPSTSMSHHGCPRHQAGQEELTADIPNVSEEATKDLDETAPHPHRCLIKEGDILIRKMLKG